MRRRDFLRNTTWIAATGGVGGVAAGAVGDIVAPTNYNKSGPGLKLKKSLKYDMLNEDLPILDRFKLYRDLGFDGVELETPNDFTLEKVLNAKEKSGLEIPGVVCAGTWSSTLSHERPEVRAKGLELIRQSLEDCKAYGGTTVLVIPGVCNSKTNYKDVYERSQAEIRKLFPDVERTGVKIAFENVWNNFLLSPLESARYVDEINHPMIGWYLDVGNVVRYGFPHHWIEILGKRIMKLDIKEYSNKKAYEEGTYKGFFVELLDGDCNWPLVNEALRKIGYQGWGSAEIEGGPADRKRLLTISQRMDEIAKL
jgi:hexulose-6-phosphate isomerase